MGAPIGATRTSPPSALPAMGGVTMPMQAAAPATAVPTQVASAQPISDARAGTTAGTKLPKTGAKPAKHANMVKERTKPDDVAKATRNLEAAMSFFGKLKRTDKDISFRPEGAQTHGKLSKEIKERFERKFPGLTAPRSIVFSREGTVPLGVLYNEKQKETLDLGKGNQHSHHEGGNLMQHVWFTPDDLELAFSDVAEGASAKVRAIREPDFGHPGGKNTQPYVPTQAAAMPGMDMTGHAH